MSNKRDVRECLKGVRCPRCLRIEFVGYLGGAQKKKFFCAECCIEFTVTEKTKNVTMAAPTDDGDIEKILTQK